MLSQNTLSMSDKWNILMKEMKLIKLNHLFNITKLWVVEPWPQAISSDSKSCAHISTESIYLPRESQKRKASHFVVYLWFLHNIPFLPGKHHHFHNIPKLCWTNIYSVSAMCQALLRILIRSLFLWNFLCSFT